jgi:hypothetical protein
MFPFIYFYHKQVCSLAFWIYGTCLSYGWNCKDPNYVLLSRQFHKKRQS